LLPSALVSSNTPEAGVQSSGTKSGMSRRQHRSVEALLTAIDNNFLDLCKSDGSRDLVRNLLSPAKRHGEVHQTFDDVLGMFARQSSRLSPEIVAILLSDVEKFFVSGSNVAPVQNVGGDRMHAIVSLCFAIVKTHISDLSANERGVHFIQTLCDYVVKGGEQRPPETCKVYDATVVELRTALEKSKPESELAKWMRESAQGMPKESLMPADRET